MQYNRYPPSLLSSCNGHISISDIYTERLLAGRLMPHSDKLAYNSIFLLLLFIPHYSASYWEKQKLLFLEKTIYPFYCPVPRTPALLCTIYCILILFSFPIYSPQLSIVPLLMLSSSILAISLLSTIFTTEPVTLHASLQYVLLTHIFSVLFPFNSCTPQGLCQVKNSSSREKKPLY